MLPLCCIRMHESLSRIARLHLDIFLALLDILKMLTLLAAITHISILTTLDLNPIELVLRTPLSLEYRVAFSVSVLRRILLGIPS